MQLTDYYRKPAVRERITEFLQSPDGEGPGCAYISTSDGSSPPARPGGSPEGLGEAMEEGHEIFRSMWDRFSLLVDIDLEYVNFDYPGVPYLHPGHAFGCQAFVVRCIEEMLLEWGIVPLHLISGRGHHFVWRIDRQSQCFDRFVSLGRPTDQMKECYEAIVSPALGKVGERLGKAFHGLGMVMEYLGHEVIRRASSDCDLSIQLTAVEAGPEGARGREVVSLDISEYGDPIQFRTLRVPYGAYLKAQRTNRNIPAMTVLPQHEMGTDRALSAIYDLEKAAVLARRASARIPDQTNGSLRLLESYEQSRLAEFHGWFYSEEIHQEREWDQTYDLLPEERLPPCIRKIVRQPNDLLLKPAGIQLVVRALTGWGWHPRHIAGFLESKYRRDHGWRKGVHFDEPSSRADFYTRLFSGLISSGVDTMVDFNCVSTLEKGYCVQNCPSDPLLPFRGSILARRDNAKLGREPFNKNYQAERKDHESQ